MTLLTIREAAHATGHSTHKIRRLIKAIADDPENGDRSLVEPSPVDVQRLSAEGVQFTWRISEDLVRRQLGDTPTATTMKNESGVGESPDVLALLQRAMTAKENAEAKLFDQLKTKDEQIAGLQHTVTSLNERLRESNVLMASLQRQLPEGRKDATDNRKQEPHKSSAAPSRPTKSERTEPKPRRRKWLKTFLGRR